MRRAHPRLLGARSSPSARCSTAAKKGSLDDLGMAVVVQRMVQPDVSGVLFTFDPTQGPPRPHGRRGRVRARRGASSPASSRPTTTSLARDGRVSERAGARAAVRDRPRPRRRVREERAAAPSGARRRRSATSSSRELAKVGDRPRGAARRPAGHRVGDAGRRALRAAVAAGDDMNVAAQTIRVVNPATGQEVAGYDEHSDADIDGAIGAAHDAQRAWAETSFDERALRRPGDGRGPPRAPGRVRAADHRRDGQAARRGRGRGREVRVDLRLLRRARRRVPGRRARRDPRARRATSPSSRSASCWRSCRGTSRSGRSSASRRRR